MNKRNCPNCGAPINVETNKCSFCGTSYFDLSTIDITGHEPFYLKIRMLRGDKVIDITQKCVADISDISMEMSSDTVDAVDSHGNTVMQFTKGHNISTNITFHAVPDKGAMVFVNVNKMN